MGDKLYLQVRKFPTGSNYSQYTSIWKKLCRRFTRRINKKNPIGHINNLSDEVNGLAPFTGRIAQIFDLDHTDGVELERMTLEFSDGGELIFTKESE